MYNSKIIALSPLKVWMVLGAILLMRLFYLHVVPLQLVPDEAYYWDWSRHLDIGYFSKPPLVAWLIHLSTELFGINEFGVRFFAPVLATASVGMVFLLARDLFGEGAALLASLFSIMTPGNAALSTIMTIDPPLVFFGSACLFFLWRAVTTSNKFLYFFLSGLCMGLGILSKQIMLIYLFLVPVFLLWEKDTRKELSSPSFFLFLLLSLIGLFLPLYWNFTHHWVTFQETAHHFEGNGSLLMAVKTFFEYVGGQLFLITPLIALSLYYVIIKSLVIIKTMDRRERFLFIFGVLPLLGFLIMSLRQRINANWPALFYPPAIILLGGWICKGKDNFLKRLQQGYVKGALVVALLFVMATYASPFIFSISPLSGSHLDPLRRARGWKEMARGVEKVYKKEYPSFSPLYIFTDRRQVASEMAFYMSFHPWVYKWDRTPHVIKDQYELWGTPFKSHINILMIFRRGEDISPLMSWFEKIISLTEVKRPLGGGRYRLYNVFLGYNFKARRRIVTSP